MSTPPHCFSSNMPLAVVIGGAGGMGLASVRRLAQRHRVLLVDIDAAKAQTLATQLYDEGHNVIAHPCDISDPDSLSGLFTRAAQLGPIQTLAYVLGLSPSMADWQRIINVNLVSAARVAEAALPMMAVGGAALFVSSLAAHATRPAAPLLPLLDAPLAADFLTALVAAHGQEPTPGEAYGLSKLGLLRLCRRLAGIWGEQDVRILSLSPGLIRTPMGDLEFRNQPTKYQLLERTPLKRQGNLNEIVDAVEFLCSTRASFITGTDLLIDGGIAAAVEFDS